MESSATSLPHVMKAVVIPSTGGPEKLHYTESQSLPTLADGQILVKNTYAGVNFVDIYYRTGLYPSATGYPLILGQEAAGIVVAIQGSNPCDFKMGDRVVWIGSGGYAEYTALHGGQAIKIPPGISDADAVGSHLTGMTALSLVKEAFPAVKGQTVLVHAAAGGVGLILCQLLHNEGVEVIATAGGPDKCALAKENGATHVVDYISLSSGSWAEKVLEITGGQGVDGVYDSVGRDTWKDSIKVTKRKGRVVFFGGASGPVPPLDLGLIRAKNLTVIQPTLPNYIATRKEFEFYANGVLELVQAGKIKVKRRKEYSLEDIAQAHEDLEARRSVGKLLLKL